MIDMISVDGHYHNVLEKKQQSIHYKRQDKKKKKRQKIKKKKDKNNLTVFSFPSVVIYTI